MDFDTQVKLAMYQHVAEMRGIFARLGLEGDFWDSTSDRFR